jgi:hypothetical protein
MQNVLSKLEYREAPTNKNQWCKILAQPDTEKCNIARVIIRMLLLT